MKKKVLVIIALITSTQMYPQKILQLEECRQLALTHNKSLQMAQESVNAARELKKAAFTQFLPNFSANGTYNWNQKNLSLFAAKRINSIRNHKIEELFSGAIHVIINLLSTLFCKLKFSYISCATTILRYIQNFCRLQYFRGNSIDFLATEEVFSPLSREKRINKFCPGVCLA